MKLVLFQTRTKPDVVPGVLTDRGVVSIAGAVPAGHTPQLTMQGIIDHFDTLRPALERQAREAPATPLSDVQLRPPLPRPGKILACIANYWEHGALDARPLNMFLKSSDAVIGPGDTIVLLYPGAEPSVDQSRCGLEGQELPRRGLYVSYALRLCSNRLHYFFFRSEILEGP